MAISAEHLRSDRPLTEWTPDYEPIAFSIPGEEAAANGGTALSAERHFDPDSILFREGAEASSVYAIRGGIVKLVRHLPNGRARIVGLHGPGGVIGLPAGAGGAPVNPHSAIALGPVDTRCWSAVHMRRLRRDEPERYIELLETLYGQVRQADLWITEFSTGRIRSRVARLILFLERTEDGPSPGEVELLTCQDMAEMLGVTPESVSRIMADMKRRQLLVPVATEPVERFLCDLEALQAVARD
ncbi:MAG TPA: Crp/Fnr family transcriptional regulator [Woeseiaceae bacterium]|nr:Crp/Fnr family transcriptional regulator [Woeseiaceae bacterium]